MLSASIKISSRSDRTIKDSRETLMPRRRIEMSTGVTSSRNRRLMWLVKWRLRSENMKNFVNKEKLNKEPTKIIKTNKAITLVRSPRYRQRWKKRSVSKISSKRSKHA